MPTSLRERVCVVTGASRGIGKAVAVALGQSGATVYITGRTINGQSRGTCKVSGCLKETAQLIEDLGGKAIPVAVDHSDDSQVAGLFSRIRREQGGRLDVLVNSAYSASDYLITEAVPESVYWEPSTVARSPSEEWDLVNRVGLRNAYTCCVLATRLMVECRSRQHLTNGESTPALIDLPTGVIINLSSIGGTQRLFNVLYCVGKSALDRMSMEMARDLRRRNVDVAVISLLLGPIQTETVLAALESGSAPRFITDAVRVGLDMPLELPGEIVCSLVDQSRQALISQSGKCLFGTELARKFRLRDRNGKYPKSPLAVKSLLQLAGWKRLAYFVPEFLKIPLWALAIMTSKF
ncbi:unnamed protein product [Dicrocoelium dendriticum]|nr:unnamed protein product [Dicrocoelium dendriticum]